MIERGSGRTSGLTEWRLMDLLSMWACIQDHDTAGHWKQVAGWRKVCDLAQAHLGRLKEYRRGLAEAWPPATNAAARAYLGELDDLIDKVQRTHDTAAANYDALAAATRAISSARVELKPLHDEYVTKLQQKRTYKATLADPKAAMGSRVPDKPVTDVDLERLNAQARNLMYGLSGELQQAQVMLRQPPTVRPPMQADSPDVYGSSTVPTIPPVVPVPLGASNIASTPSRLGNAPRLTPPPTRAGVEPILGSGPILGGTNTALTPTGSSATNPGAHNPASLGSQLGSPSAIPIAPSTSNRHVASDGSRGNLNGDQRPLNGASGTPSAFRSMPPGGLIGTTPGMGLSQPGGTTPTRRVNPIGGVIGGGGAGTAPSGAAGSRPGAARSPRFDGGHFVPPIGGSPSTGNFSMLGDSGGRSRREEQSEGESRRWDPDHPWRTETGVTPVVRPPVEDGPIDPGPAIGFDR